MKQTLLFLSLIFTFKPAQAADTLYWYFILNSSKTTTECVKMKEKDFQKMNQEMSCAKAFASGILFCSGKRVLFYYPDEKQCQEHKSKIK